MKKIWIDTDIGGDIDDALALALALSRDDVEIVGISTVFENTILRAKMAKKIVNLSGKNVPVYAGIGLPKKQRIVFHDKVDLNKYPKTYIKEEFDDVEIDGIDAVENLRDAVENHNDLTVISIGALTNIATLLEKYPDTYKKIKNLYIMGTAVGCNFNEFNITCDPDSANEVLSSDINIHVVSLDITFRCELDKKTVKQLSEEKSPVMMLINKMRKAWGETVILHDPLTVSEAIEEKYVTFVNGNLEVILSPIHAAGKVINLCDFNWHQTPKDNLHISYDVKNEEFAKYFMKQINRLNRGCF